MTSENSENTNIVLPEEIVTEIISRLPVKPVFQLQCLSKNFSSITNDVNFINAHLGHSARLRPSIIFNKGHDIYLIRNNGRESETVVEEMPLHRIINFNSNKMLKIEASCNGLVIFSVDDNDCFIWNPATMQCDNLPNPSIVVDWSVWISGWGFGYCTESSQYKIVRIASYSAAINIWGNDETVVEVMSYGTDCEWRRLDFSKFDQFCDGPGLTIKGVVYWTVLNDNKLLSFDLEKEEFAWIICPLAFSGCEKIMEFQGSLAACEDWNFFLNIWVLKDSWEIICSTRDIYPYSPIRFLNDHQLFLVQADKNVYFNRNEKDPAEFSCALYDMESEEIKGIPQALVSTNSDILNFVESMVPLLSLVDLLVE